MIEKAQTLHADEVVIDLEDSVPAGAKDDARATVVAAVREGSWGDRIVTVRVNGPDSPHCYRDVIELTRDAGENLSGLVIPKAERAGDIEFVARLAGMVEKETGRTSPVLLQALIETAKGLSNVREIAHAGPRLEALIVGYADLAASLGRPMSADGYPGDRWHHVADSILVAARDAGLQAIDGPYLDIADQEGFLASADRAWSLGYDGKWALHPSQIEPLNDRFTPTREEFDNATAVLAALEDEEGAGRGAALHEGAMIDEASRKHALRTVARGTAAGLG